MDKITVLIIVIIIFAGCLFWGFQTGFFAKIFSNNPEPVAVPEGIVLFYGEGCPHCKNVDDFITQNNIEQKVKFTRLEIPFNGKTSPQLVANAKLAIQLAQGCKLDVSRGVSIPFLYDGKNCLLGDEPVINFLKTQAGIK